MGYLLSNLASLKTLDLSNNNIHDTIPFQLPPNLTSLNLAHNNLSGGLSYSIMNMVSLTDLNVSSNSLSQPIADVFANHTALATMNVANNHFTGWVPKELTSISNFVYDSNSFDNGPAPPPPPYTPPPPGTPARKRHRSSGTAAQSPENPDSQASSGKKKSTGTIID